MSTKVELRPFLNLKILSMCLFMAFSVNGLHAQKGQKPPKDPQKEALKEQSEKDKKIEKDIKRIKKEYKKKQDRPVRKRMKKTAKKSNRNSLHKKDPFFQRVFRGPKYKKVRKEKEE